MIRPTRARSSYPNKVIKLYYPDATQLLLAGAKPASSITLRYNVRHPAAESGGGVLVYHHSKTVFDGQAFRAARDNFGAVLVYNSYPRHIVCAALRVPLEEKSIIEAYTQAQWAEMKKISRQAVNEQVAAKKLKTLEIGEHDLILPKNQNI